MESMFETFLRTFTEQCIQMNHKFDRLDQRLGNLEKTHKTHPEPKFETHPDPFLEPSPRIALHHDLIWDLRERRPNYDLIDQDERATRFIRLEAPTFGGDLDLEDYINWEEGMDLNFERKIMSEGSQFKFAKLKLVCQARIYLDDVERMIRRR